MAAGASFSLTVTRTTTPGDCPSIQNTAVLSSATQGTPQANNTSGPIQITVNCPDVTITKAAAQITVNAGDQATYTITVTNNGPGDAANVTLTDTVPNSVAAPGWAVGGANAASCAPNPVAGGALLTCNFGTVAAGQSRTITLTATTTPANCPVINNSAHVAASNEAAAQQGNNDVGPIPINVNCPDVTVTKAAAQITISAGGQASYTITVTNNGPGDAAGVTLTDTVPNSVAAPGWAVGGANAASCAPNPVAGGTLLTCNFGTVAAGQSRTITLTATTTTANCPVINNSTHVAASNEAAAQQGNNDAGPVPITVNCPDVTVTKAAAQITISAGDQATYTITVTNNGPGDATGVTLTDTVPGAVAAPGWAVGGANAASCAPNPVAGGTLLTCTFGTVAAGQSRTITLTATTTPANCPVINNSAHVAASNEAAAQQGNNNAGPVPINVNCPPDLHIVKTPDGTTYNAGDTIHFTIVVSNSGPGTAINVRFSPLDTLPDPNGTLNWGPTNPTVTCTQHAGATCTVSAVSPGVPNSQTLSCSFGNIAAGESCTVTVDSATQADQPEDCVASPGLVNTACAVADNAGQVCNDASQHCEGKV